MTKVRKMKSILPFALITLFFIGCSESLENKKNRAIKEIEDTRALMEADFENDTFNVAHVLDAAQAYKNYTVQFPEDSINTPGYMFEAIQLFAVGSQFDTSLAMTNRFEKLYPNHERAADVLHHKAFAIFDNGLKDFKKAEEFYLDFIAKYPKEKELVKTTLFLLDHLGQDDADILNQILSDTTKTTMP